MTTCSTEQCGVMGTGSGTRPGDPDGNSILTASPAFGGIDVTWSYPTTNPHAVSYGILYRGVLPDFTSAIVIANVGGNFFYDKSTNETSLTYYYWVRLVSINGTVGELIGPASAAARPPIADVITGLTGKIDVGTLATSLRNEIDKVEFYHEIFLNERSVRVAADIQFGSLLAQYSADLDQLQAYLSSEIVARQVGQDNLLGSVNTVALASEQNIAAVQTTLQTSISSVDGKVTAIGALYTAKVSVNGLIGGFGIFNDGTEVEAGFDVDSFWIGRTQANKRKPFIIQNGEVFIDQAVINQLTFTKLRDEAGSVMVENGKLKADYITVKEIRSADGKFVIDAVNKTITIEV